MSYKVAERIIWLFAVLTPKKLIGSSWYYTYFHRWGWWNRLFHTRDVLAIYMRANRYPPFAYWQTDRLWKLLDALHIPYPRRWHPVRGGFLVPEAYQDALLTRTAIRGASYTLPVESSEDTLYVTPELRALFPNWTAAQIHALSGEQIRLIRELKRAWSQENNDDG